MPDNITVGEDGKVYTVGFNSFEDAQNCLGSGFSKCSNDWRSVVVNPDDMTVKFVSLRHEIPFFGPTVTVPVDGWLYVGALTGDRIMGYRLTEQED